MPTRIDLLELDIDVRLADLWREAVDVTDWNIEVVAAFIRAAYGKGYCDALVEESPGALCVEHGYRIPERPGAGHLRAGHPRVGHLHSVSEPAPGSTPRSTLGRDAA